MERMAGLLVLMVWFTAVAASTPSASPPPQMVASPWRPVAVNLQVAAVNHTGLVKVARRESRTVPAFFEETLGILRGQPLTFDVDRWRAIQRSGLFKNLTAKAFANPDGEVTLHVYGEELPSVRFSPEVSVAASLDKPEASGGVVFSDRNFRGMGQRLDIQVTKKEGTEAGTDALRPTVTVKWGGNGIGKTTSVSAGYDDESSLQDAADLVPLAQLHARVAAAAASAGTSRHRIQNQVRRAFVKFQDMDFGGLARKHARRGLDAAPLNCLVEVDLEPYIEASHALGDNGNGDGDGDGSTLLQGAKLTAVARWAGGATATAAHDGGVGTYSWGSAPYHQVTMELTSPPLAVRGQPSDATGGSWLRRAFGEVTARVRAKALGSWGGARLPLSHGVALGDAQVVRSHGDTPGNHFLRALGPHKRRATAFAGVKADIYADGATAVKPGIFADFAVYRAPWATATTANTATGGGGGATGEVHIEQRVERTAGAGLSLRGFGFRTDVAWPIHAPWLTTSPPPPVPAPVDGPGALQVPPSPWARLGHTVGALVGRGKQPPAASGAGGTASSAAPSRRPQWLTPRVHFGIDLAD